MARVTVEDCIEKIPNRFNLVVTAAQRAKEISAGAQLLVERDNDKNAVVALREIAEGVVTHQAITDGMITRLRKNITPLDHEADLIDDDEELIGKEPR